MNTFDLTKFPAVISNERKETLSDRYKMFNTGKVIEMMEHEGWYVAKARQRVARDKSLAHVKQHMVRFRNDNVPRVTFSVGDIIPEVVILNSHDGSTPFKMFGGLYRLACENGLVVTQNEYMNISARHMGIEQDTLHQMLIQMLDKFLLLNERVSEMKARELMQGEQLLFANKAIQLRWKGKMLVSPDEVLKPRRPQDAENDLWTVFNRIQENCIKGGLYITTNAKNERIVTRKITNVSEDIRINTGLYKLAEELI